ncbi:unnamed protein product, partial [Chrysoparadoxa australica]
CPAGVYGSSEEEQTEVCSGPCPGGYYCPVGTVEPLPCTGSNSYCPLGSSRPQPVDRGYYSVKGVTHNGSFTCQGKMKVVTSARQNAPGALSA